jgi:hypothetical protein
MDEKVKEGEDKTPELEKEEPKVEGFLKLLVEGEIKEGDKIGFLPNGAETETVITVDKSFLELELQPSEFYEKFKYNLK